MISRREIGPVRLHIYPDYETLSRAAAELFATRSAEAVKLHGRFSVALSGGSGPVGFYELLARAPYRERVDWKKVHFFWGDERCVPEDDPRSNARLARRAFLASVPVPEDQVHPIRCHDAPASAAESYETLLKSYCRGCLHTFDLAIMGMGEDGHTASLFPGDPALMEQERWAVAVYKADEDLYRVTLTTPVFNRSETVLFLVAGREKARALQEVLEGPYDPQRLPAQSIRPVSGELLWLVDEAAAELVSELRL
ncbi:MAG: 6-phosphogluconolactonase [Deltaproteobacteria bacterium]|nr:6-phosphogluconolactonase [Deltaproteobacteria bacterium]